VGAAGYEPWWAQHGPLDYHVRNAHSLFVETGAELGIVGFLLLLGFLAAFKRADLPIQRAHVGGLAALGVGLACVHDQRQSTGPGCRDMGAKHLLLNVAWAVIVVKIESGLANANNARMFGERG
jgi:hypothetical protein